MLSCAARNVIGIAGEEDGPGDSTPRRDGRSSPACPEGLDSRSAGLLHDLRNMLAVAHSGTNLLRSPMGAEQRAGIVDAVQQALRHVESLVAGVADFQPFAAIRRQWVDLGALLARQAALYRCHLPDDILLRIDTRSRLPRVWLDQAMLEAALLNLVRNASEAMSSGGCLTIRTKKLADRLRLIVADTGSGMDPDTLRRAGTPWFTRKPGSGTGLGLAQVRRCLGEAGGRLAVRSRVGQGTIFCLDLPV